MQLVNAFHNACEFGRRKKKPLKKIEMRFLRNITNEIANPQDSSSEVL